MRLIDDDPPQSLLIESKASVDGGLFGLGDKESLDSIFITTAKLDAPGPQIVFVSPAFSRMTGYLEEELMGCTPLILQGPKTDHDVLRRLHERMAAGESFSGEMIYYRKDGSECAVELQVSPIRDHRGEITHFVSIQRTPGDDAAEKERFEAMVLRAQRMESIGALASAMAHDLNNVLAPILMALHTLQQKFTDEGRCLALIRQSAEQGKDLVERVLAFARGAECEPAPLRTINLIGGVARILEETLPKNIELQVQAPDDLWSVIGDATQLQQVLMNLCINARDAMPAGGKLMIDAGNRFLSREEKQLPPSAPPNQFVRITVADTGVGIPSEIIDHVFDPFFTTKERGQGSGLGLSTVHAIVRRHGGFINLLSQEGMGTEFKVYLPAQSSRIEDRG
jgi:two-component system, cell cycle sensor histidine kinase and response regulator CckA